MDHIWIECLRQALYVELELLHCKIRVHPDKGIEEVRRLKGNLFSGSKRKDGKVSMKSRITRCRHCNRENLTHFAHECIHGTEEWQLHWFPCYRCHTDNADHILEECWKTGTKVMSKDKLLVGLDLRSMAITARYVRGACPVCGTGLKIDCHGICCNAKELLHVGLHWHVHFIEDCRSGLVASRSQSEEHA